MAKPKMARQRPAPPSLIPVPSALLDSRRGTIDRDARPRMTAVYLMDPSGIICIFDGILEALSHFGWGWIRASYSGHLYPGAPPYTPYSYSFFDDFGEQISIEEFARLVLDLQWPEPPWCLIRPWTPPGMPVPGTAKRRGNRHFHRRPKTQPERRLNALVLTEDGEVAARAVRTGTNLVSSWSDLMVANRGHNTWKRQRRTRYKLPRAPKEPPVDL